MQDFIQETSSGIYRITKEGLVFSQSKLKIPLVGAGMKFSGDFKLILKPERALKLTINNRGYQSVAIMKKTFMVHRLVALAFIPNPLSKPFVNHMDGNRLNNNFNNLEWCTTAENNAHARANGLHVQARGHRIKYKSADTKAKSLTNLKDKSALTDDEVRYVRQVCVPKHPEYSGAALARRFGVSRTAMYKIVSGVTYPDVV